MEITFFLYIWFRGHAQFQGGGEALLRKGVVLTCDPSCLFVICISVYSSMPDETHLVWKLTDLCQLFGEAVMLARV